MTPAAEQYEEHYDDEDAPTGLQTLPDDTQIDESVPEGFQDMGGDLVGYWEAASQRTAKRDALPGSPAVLFTPLFVTLSDSKLKPRPGEAPKSATLLHARLERPCRLRAAKKEDGYRVFPAGSLFGIWTKPGMRRLETLGGVTVWMKNAGFKEMGEGKNDMVQFDIKATKDGERLRVKEDRRNESLPAKLREARAQVAEKFDDIPF